MENHIVYNGDDIFCSLSPQHSNTLPATVVELKYLDSVIRLCDISYNNQNRSGLARLMSVLNEEIEESSFISIETEEIIARITEREENIEKLRKELYQF